MHNLTADPFISRMVEELSEEHKEVLYFLSLRLYSSTPVSYTHLDVYKRQESGSSRYTPARWGCPPGRADHPEIAAREQALSLIHI